MDRAAQATAALTSTALATDVTGLGALLALGVRSEAIASSVIEGLQASARRVAMADFTGHGTTTARQIARNTGAMTAATHDLAARDRIDLDDVLGLQAMLVPHLPGLRQEQVWIGGPTPLGAVYVPPQHHHVPMLMADLLAYLNDPPDTAVVAAAVVHAQFETIHPFRDGNGRIGRALTHTVLARAGYPTVVPFSRVLSARRDVYLDALTAWRRDDDARLVWVEVFLEALVEAVAHLHRLRQRLAELDRAYRERLDGARRDAGRKAPRRDAAALHLLEGLADHPIDTAATAAHRLGVSSVAARSALEELASVGVYRTEKVEKGKTLAYLAVDVLNLADLEPL